MWGCLQISWKLLNPYQLFFSQSVFARIGNDIFFDFYHFLLLERECPYYVCRTEIYFSQLSRVEHYQRWRAAKLKDEPRRWCRRSFCVVRGRKWDRRSHRGHMPPFLRNPLSEYQSPSRNKSVEVLHSFLNATVLGTTFQQMLFERVGQPWGSCAEREEKMI